jgi:hypothetical protein
MGQAVNNHRLWFSESVVFFLLLSFFFVCFPSPCRKVVLNRAHHHCTQLAPFRRGEEFLQCQRVATGFRASAGEFLVCVRARVWGSVSVFDPGINSWLCTFVLGAGSLLGF